MSFITTILHSFMKDLVKHLILLSLHKEFVNVLSWEKQRILKSISKMQCSDILQAGFWCKQLLSVQVGIRDVPISRATVPVPRCSLKHLL